MAKPVLTFTNATSRFRVDNPYVEYGAAALDDRGVDISAGVVITGTVPSATPGIYRIRYDVTDYKGEAAVPLFRTVTIYELDGPTNTKSMYKYRDKWILSTKRRHYAKDLVPGGLEIFSKCFYTESGGPPMMREGANIFQLGIPLPAAPTITVSNPGDTSNPALIEEWSYIFTYVDKFGFEGPSSPASNVGAFGPDGIANITFPALPIGNYSIHGSSGVMSRIRLYRSNAGTETANYQFVQDLALDTSQHFDSTPSSELKEVVSSGDNTSPPTALLGLVAMPGAFLCGYVDSTLYFSKPGMPHAWPLQYRVPIDEPIVGTRVVPGGLFVATRSDCFLVVGSSPEAMQPVSLKSGQGCFIESSMVVIAGAVYYVSPDGLCRYSNQQVDVVTAPFISREQWQRDFQLSTFDSFSYENKYVGMYVNNSGAASGMIFDHSGGENALSFFLPGVYIKATYRDEIKDQTFIAYGFSNTSRERFGVFNEGLTSLRLTWQSKIFQLAKPTNMSYLRIAGDEGVVVVTVMQDGEVFYQNECETNKTYRIQSRRRSAEWQVKVESDVAIDWVGLYANPKEIQQGGYF